MTDVTQILSQIEKGDLQAAEDLLPLLYAELRRLAVRKMSQESPGHTLQPTALVHEVYVRLVDVEQAQHWDSRGHFFAAAAEAMRRILVENARRKKRVKHGGLYQRADLLEVDVAEEQTDPGELLAVDEALEQLATENPRKAELVKLRYFAGLSLEETAEAMEISRATAARDWTFAKAWLFDFIVGRSESD